MSHTTATGSIARRRRLIRLVAVLGIATASATYLQGALSVLAADVIETLDLSRSRLGIAFAVFSLTGGLLAPVMGRLADWSSRGVMTALFALAASGVLIAAVAPSYPWLIVAALVGGLALASGNPVTNRLVSEHISLARRGLVLGIKQAGPPMGLFAAGLLLPPLALLAGWRWALAATAVVPLLAMVATRFVVPDETAEPVASQQKDEPHRSGPAAVGWLTGIGFAVAMGAGAVLAFLPLYSQEVLGLSSSAAGWLAGLLGFSGVVGRVWWGAAASRFRHTIVPLTALAVASLGASVLVLASEAVVPLVWVAAVAAGGSMLGWHSVAWLALLGSVDRAGIGRSTGLVQTGNSFGFALGPPTAGAIIDTTGSYALTWTVVAGIFAIALTLTLVWRRTAAE